MSVVAQTEQVDRVSKLSVEEFQSEYLSRRPVIVTDSMLDWPALDLTVERLRQRFAGALLPLRMDDGEFDAFCAATGDQLLRDSKDTRKVALKGLSFWVIRLDSYFEGVNRAGSDAARLPGVLDVPLTRGIIEQYLRVLKIDASEDWDPLITALGSLIDDVHFPSYLTGNRDYRFWFTPGHRRQGPIHADGYDNLNAQVRGRKEWFLQAPSADGRRREGEPLSCTTGPGEILYIPRSWWHAATALDSCININAWHTP